MKLDTYPNTFYPYTLHFGSTKFEILGFRNIRVTKMECVMPYFDISAGRDLNKKAREPKYKQITYTQDSVPMFMLFARSAADCFYRANRRRKAKQF